MDKLLFTSRDELTALTAIREGETKLGQRMATAASLEELQSHRAKYVLIGIPEDVGVRANGGQPGAAGNWEPVLRALCNIQSTAKMSGEELLVLGTINVTEEQFEAGYADTPRLPELVVRIDEKVAALMQLIFDAGKTPLVIGGGHNNAYPLLKALSASAKQAVNALNIDAHADFRKAEGRHSGNGFSYAFEAGYLAKYAIFGLHENYNSQYLLDRLNAHPGRISPVFFEDFLRKDTRAEAAFGQALEFVQGVYGLELDLDCMAGVAASAATPSGFSAEQVRSFIYQTRGQAPAYFHICEGIARPDNLLAKLIAYLISDFVKAQA